MTVKWILGTAMLLQCAACSNDSEDSILTGTGTGQFGEPCQKTEDCASGICVRVADTVGVCSKACDSTRQCPAIDNWECLEGKNAAIRVCACLKLNDAEICGDGLDNDCNGVADNCRICDGAAVAVDDPKHCGTCNNACRRDQLCDNGQCRCVEPKADDCGVCTDLASDAEHCGSCSTACPAGQSCKAGACSCPSTAAPNYCAERGCVALDSDANDCGVCGTSCTLGQVCSAGACACSVATTTFCPGIGCIDLHADAKHCGSCDQKCGPSEVCHDGTCACPDGKTRCGGACVDLQSDSAHCGACSSACGSAQACVEGKCGCADLGYTVCGSDCVNLPSDAKHCGECGKACAPGERCTSGACVCDSNLHCEGACVAASDTANCGACNRDCAGNQLCSTGACVCQGAGLTACGDQCVSLTSDAKNCGACGVVCRISESCTSGQCKCPRSQTYCDGAAACVDLTTSSTNCGSCGNVCATGQTCVASTCKCPAGQTFCDAAGACVTLTTSADHCGVCGNACRNGETCSMGTCVCPTGQTYCEAAGKCVTLTNDTSNCGACENTCRSTQVCETGQCRCAGSGQSYCASAGGCIDTYSDEANCGSCDKVCPTGTECNFGTCYCAEKGQSICGQSCYDLSTDVNHCGTCDNACSNGRQCLDGKCSCPAPTTGTAVRITSNSVDDSFPAAAWDGSHVGVLYGESTAYEGYTLHLALLAPDGAVISDTIVATQAYRAGAYGGWDLIWNGQEYALFWSSGTNTQTMKFLRLDAMAQPKGTGVITLAAVSGGNYLFSPTLAWSPSYGGYAVAYQYGGSNVFRRIGSDGTAPELANTSSTSLADYKAVRLQSAPDGTWGLAYFASTAMRFQVYNADGSRTATLATWLVSWNSGTLDARWPAMIHDGSDWLTVWPGANRGLTINRGTVLNSPTVLVTNSYPVEVSEPVVVNHGSSLTIAWTQRADSTSACRYLLQRFTATSPTTSAFSPLSPISEILPSTNITTWGSVALASTGPNSLLAVWSDNRWGAAREIYAAPVDLHACH